MDDHASCGRGERLAAALAKERLSEGGGDATAHLDLEIFELPEDNDYLATETVCQVLPKGVAAILGPSSSPASAAIISHVCGEKEIPHVKLGPEGNTPVQSPRGSSVNLFPSPADISRAVASLLTAFNHSICSLLCTQTDCLLRHEELMRRFPISREGFSVRLVPEGADPTPLLKEIREDKISTIIIDASINSSLIGTFILLLSFPLFLIYSYVLFVYHSSQDFSLLHLEGQLQGYPRILGFSLYDEKHPFYPEFSRSLNLSQHSCVCLCLKAGLLFDALHGVVRAARALNRSQALAVQPLSCSSTRVWYHGTSLLNYLRMVEYNGLTGRVEFDSRGQRSNYSLRVLQLRRDGLKEIGKWHSQKGLTLDTVFPTAGPSTSLVNRTLIVTSIVENPYLMLKENHKQLRGNDRYQGFCVDLLQEIAAILRFRYAIRLVSDGIYGAPEPNGSWTGLVGELIQGKADLAVASFTITAEREKVIDFSKPFMTLGISILYRVHVARKPGYFSFLDPFSPAVWLFMLLAYLAVSCILFLVARLTPYEWYNPYPCLRAGPSGGRLAVNQYTLGNSLWFPIGGFMQQGSEIMPRALSTRCISGVWSVLHHKHVSTDNQKLNTLIHLGLQGIQRSERCEGLKRSKW
uniref:Glutamate ionotropic receptor kainate type subunit 5 n=1 Tax=Eptatretus burgeri TaxID=7764 RepID=A0A8C4QTL6_EPTBU